MTDFIWRAGHIQNLALAGVTLEACCWGPPPAQAPTLVLLHEGLGCVALWRDFPQKLADATQCGVFAWSRAGYGGSDACPLPRPLNYMSIEAATMVPRLLEHIGVANHVLIGHSDGASIAALHAGAGNDPRLRGLVLMAPHFFTEPVGLAAIAKARRAYETGDLRARLAKYHRHVDAAFRGWNDAWLDPGFAGWNIEACIATINVPVLAIQGTGDQYGTPAQIEGIAPRCPARVQVALLEDCRHTPFLDQPETTLALVKDFVAGLGLAGDDTSK
ncbi:MAG: alpha/beta hydrolase [Hyphomicrobiales bacterium]|nr:alpha/beta hydrolase [Hyphomicrobiales bacterium]